MNLQERQAKAEQEKLEHKEQKKRYNALVARVRSNCYPKKAGLLAVKCQAELVEKAVTTLPDGMSLGATIDAYKEGIKQYENQIKKEQDEK